LSAFQLAVYLQALSERTLFRAGEVRYGAVASPSLPCCWLTADS
jgi:hypothetical protein